MNDSASLQIRRQSLQKKLAHYGLPAEITYLPYLDYAEVTWQPPEEAAQRMVILQTLSYLAHDLNQREGAADWLMNEGLWEKVSSKEKIFLTKPEPYQEELITFSWHAEAVHTLAWALGLFDEIGPPTDTCDMEQLGQVLPVLAEPLGDFVQHQAYRPIEDIFDENLFNELATGHFRDVSLGLHHYEGPINPAVSYERHRVLNWLRKFSGGETWEETHTDT
ncbi:MAG: DUF4272 domain-containing protein [Tunicatimonas sp.]